MTQPGWATGRTKRWDRAFGFKVWIYSVIERRLLRCRRPILLASQRRLAVILLYPRVVQGSRRSRWRLFADHLLEQSYQLKDFKPESKKKKLDLLAKKNL